MFWTEEIAAKCAGAQVINDSKTPSGRVHVGALRGVLIHDAIFRTLGERGIEARYLFGSDDFDPVDEIPKGEDEHFGKYIGWPLCNTPAPVVRPTPGEGNPTQSGAAAGASAPPQDMAEHYISEFFAVFDQLGVKVERYRMRDFYRGGALNEAIDTILRSADKVRRVYKEVSGSERRDDWFPFQVICERCGRIATTEVSAYDGREVDYACLTTKIVNPKLGLGRGCGHVGKVSPFDGHGKLPWKLEWVAKWVHFRVTIEGAGKDHSTRGGSRDVSEACLRAIYGKAPPLRVPYEFFLVGGAKMSSSKGVGASAREMADLLPPEVLRFLMIRTKPNSPVNFDVHEEGIVKLFNEFDRFQARAAGGQATPDEACVYRLSELTPEGAYATVNFQLISALVQMPHLDAVREIERRAGRPLTNVERRHLEARLASARVWVERYAAEEEKTRIQERLPPRAQELTAAQRAFLHRLAEELPRAAWEDEALQSKIFEVARLTPIDQATAFKAIYRVLLDRESGPKAGNLLAFLRPEFVIGRFRELPFERLAFWRETAMAMSDLEAWMQKDAAKIESHSSQLVIENGAAANEFTFVLKDGKRLLKRVLVENGRLA